MMHNDNIVLKQEKYIDEIKKQLIQKKESLKDNINNNISQAIQHPELVN